MAPAFDHWRPLAQVACMHSQVTWQQCRVHRQLAQSDDDVLLANEANDDDDGGAALGARRQCRLARRRGAARSSSNSPISRIRRLAPRRSQGSDRTSSEIRRAPPECRRAASLLHPCARRERPVHALSPQSTFIVTKCISERPTSASVVIMSHEIGAEYFGRTCHT